MTEVRPAIRIQTATEAELPVVRQMIVGLAEYEELSSEVSATEEDLRASLFGERPAVEVLLAYAGSEPIGFAVFFSTYSTFLGRSGIYLEDLFVLPEWRKLGCGRQLMARVASIAVERGCGRMEWSVLDWNEPAIRFYRILGGERLDQWTTCRLTGDALGRLASCGSS